MELMVRNHYFTKIQFSETQGTVDPIRFEANCGLYGASANDFQLAMPLTRNILQDGYMVTLGNTEYGGVIKARLIDYAQKTVTYSGKTFRGQMEQVICNPRATAETFGTQSDNCGGMLQAMIDNTPLAGVYSVTDNVTSERIEVFIPAYCNLLKGVDLVLAAYGCTATITIAGGGVRIEVKEAGEHKLLASAVGIEVNDNRLLPTEILGYHSGGRDGSQTMQVKAYLQEDGTVGYTRFYTGVDAFEVAVDIGETDTTAGEQAYQLAKDRLLAMRNAEYLGSVESETLNAQIGDKVKVAAPEYSVVVNQIVSEKVLTIESNRQKIITRTGGNASG